MKFAKLFIFGCFLGSLVAGGYGLYTYKIKGSAPQAVVNSLTQGQAVDAQTGLLVGKLFPYDVTVNNAESGVCKVMAYVTDGQRQWALLNYQFSESQWIKKAEFKNSITLRLKGELPQDMPSQGQFVVTASDCAVLSQTTTASWPLHVDNQPPVVAITSSQHYVNQGGAGVVTYQVSEVPQAVFVTLGNNKFRGFPVPNGTQGQYFSFFVHSYDIPQMTDIVVTAIDPAGNAGTATMRPTKFFPKEFRQRELQISEDFIQTKIADIIANTPEIQRTGESLTDFLAVNRDLRARNAQFLRELAQQSQQKFFWKDAFTPLQNSAVQASFADYRSYMYNGQKVDQQVHLGFDMAAVEKYPITASADGKIAFAGYLGIYGNTVIIDHGFGIMTLYGHMSSLDVAGGDFVTRNQKLGNSGTTGLAGGDHLHYSLLIDGVQANPVEFWDQHWIEDNVYLRLTSNLFGQRE